MGFENNTPHFTDTDWQKEAGKMTFSHEVVAIFTSPDKGLPMQPHDLVIATAGQGLEGDRYHLGIGKGAYSTSKRIPVEDRMVSLVSLQGIAQANCALMDEGNLPYTLSETRRQIVVDIPIDELNALVGRRILIGDVMIEVNYLCEPCARPPHVLGRANENRSFERAFENTGGVRGRIVQSGVIAVGAVLVVLER